MDVSQCDLSAEELLFRLNSTCVDVLDSVAPVKFSKTKPRSEPWINDNIHSLRQICRRAECKWKKDRLQISFEILRDSLFKFQKAVRAAKSTYFTAIIDKNYHRPKTLFTIFNAVVNPTVCEYPDVSKTMCDDFLRFLLIRSVISGWGYLHLLLNLLFLLFVLLISASLNLFLFYIFKK